MDQDRMSQGTMNEITANQANAGSGAEEQGRVGSAVPGSAAMNTAGSINEDPAGQMYTGQTGYSQPVSDQTGAGRSVPGQTGAGRIMSDQPAAGQVNTDPVQQVDMGTVSLKPMKKKGVRKRKGMSQAIAILLVMVLSLGCGFGGGVAAMYFAPDLFGLGGGSAPLISIEADSHMDTAEAIAVKVQPSVVGISTQSVQQSPYAQLFGISGESVVQGVGTGIIVDENGYILTNSHVVNDGDTKSIKVQFYDGTEKDGAVLWNDVTLDLAIVKVEATNLTAAELGDSDEVNIGAYAVAIGNPLGLAFQRSLSQGVISGLDRSISVTDGSSKRTMDGLMQTDASINSGNSGGPLLNSRGQVIGINSAKVQSGEGMGFAIPINVAKPIVDEIKEKGEFTRAYIGIEAFGLGDYSSAYPGANLEEQLGTKEGIFVQRVTDGGGAKAAGMQAGDVIIEINGEKVTSMNNLNTKLIQYRPGETVELTVIREKKEMKFKVELKAGTAV